MESPVRILIVDDDEITREILHDAVDQPSVEIALSTDGMNALDMMAKEAFEILITDLNMPRMNGLTLLREARQLSPQLLTIIITGHGSLESAVQALRHGTFDYIQKPFKIEEMAATTRNAVQTVKMMRERKRMLRELESVHLKLRLLEEQQVWNEAIHSRV